MLCDPCLYSSLVSAFLPNSLLWGPSPPNVCVLSAGRSIFSFIFVLKRKPTHQSTGHHVDLHIASAVSAWSARRAEEGRTPRPAFGGRPSYSISSTSNTFVVPNAAVCEAIASNFSGG